MPQGGIWVSKKDRHPSYSVIDNLALISQLQQSQPDLYNKSERSLPIFQMKFRIISNLPGGYKYIYI